MNAKNSTNGLIAAAVIGLTALTGCGSEDTAKTAPSAVTAEPTKTAGAVICPMKAGDAKSFDASTLVGKTLSDAKTEAAKYSCTIRTVEVDGKSLAATMDFHQDRINVSVKDNTVVAVINVG